MAQAGAVRLGIARALVEYNAELRKALIPCRIDIEANDAKSRSDQAAGVNFSHQPNANQSDGCLGRHLTCSFLVQQTGGPVRML